MRRSPRICMGSHQAHVSSHVYTTSNVTLTSPILTHPRIGVEDPRICVEGTLAASDHARPTPKLSCVAQGFTRPTHRRGSPRICVESSLVTFKAHVWRSLN
ncbi:hypothetical protein PIB30_091793, partial [Stylosanthes scabra]|nr:hypothetical protein [Stylosanthes scabra]